MAHLLNVIIIGFVVFFVFLLLGCQYPFTLKDFKIMLTRTRINTLINDTSVTLPGDFIKRWNEMKQDYKIWFVDVVAWIWGSNDTLNAQILWHVDPLQSNSCVNRLQYNSPS
jgi:hypothetical protein